MTLDELERLEKAATPGPWRTGEMCAYPHGIPYAGGTPTTDLYSAATNDDIAECNTEADAALIAAARNTLPALLRVARAAEAYRVVWHADRPAHEAFKELEAALAALEAL